MHVLFCDFLFSSKCQFYFCSSKFLRSHNHFLKQNTTIASSHRGFHLRLRCTHHHFETFSLQTINRSKEENNQTKKYRRGECCYMHLRQASIVTAMENRSRPQAKPRHYPRERDILCLFITFVTTNLNKHLSLSNALFIEPCRYEPSPQLFHQPSLKYISSSFSLKRRHLLLVQP